MRTQVPLAICFIAGLFMAVQYFIPAFLPLYERINDYIQIVSAFAIVLGVVSVIQRHSARVRRRGPEHKRHKDWPFSVAAMTGLTVMLLAGFIGGRGQGTLFQNLFNAILLPVQATMFALLAFYLASAAFRAFRTRSTDATVLLIAAVIVMIGRLDDGATLKIPELAHWILNGPNLVAKRAIILGVGLGMMATALKVVMGIERSYLGSGKE
ncbi:MAG: hypothetical protein KAY24_15265 [Candidatus Eisenbacteria sp.]|nr:hypothetical protein [Candidatus Eisenbacteria bacterium]